MDSVLYLLAYLFNDKKLINEKTISIRVFGFVLTYIKDKFPLIHETVCLNQ